MASRDLVYDVGFFDGSDTAFYLAKGFRVVAIEARPDLCAAARAQFSDELRSGQLTLVERAIWSAAGERVPFYIRSGWSSVYRESAERDGGPSEAIVEVETTTIAALFSELGVPHYLKCDIEGAEDIVIDGLSLANPRPTFISIEDPLGEGAARLATLGYDRFQMVNQGHLRLFKPPNPPREGNYHNTIFTGRSSGLFGFELEPAYWVDALTLQQQMRLWHALRNKTVNPIYGYACKRWGKLTKRGWLVPGGWADIHATTASALEAR